MTSSKALLEYSNQHPVSSVIIFLVIDLILAVFTAWWLSKDEVTEKQ